MLCQILFSCSTIQRTRQDYKNDVEKYCSSDIESRFQMTDEERAKKRKDYEMPMAVDFEYLNKAV